MGRLFFFAAASLSASRRSASTLLHFAGRMRTAPRESSRTHIPGECRFDYNFRHDFE